jgi:N-acetylmuramoyl-L-alanine amidase
MMNDEPGNGQPHSGDSPTGPSSGGQPTGPTSGGQPTGPTSGGQPTGPTSGGSPTGPTSGGLSIAPSSGGLSMVSQPKWIEGENLFGFTVERHNLPRLHNKPFFPMNRNQRGVIHTTEGATIDGALTVLAARFDGPHFVVGGDRIVQGRPLNVQGSSLRQNPGQPLTNARAEIQIECVGFSQTKVWMFDDWTHHVFPIDPNTKKPVATPASFHGSTLKPLVALLAWLTQNTDIPLSRPSPDWKNDMSDIPLPWAVAGNHRRLSKVWDSNATGWFGHIEVQHQEFSNHFDPGALDYASLFSQAQALISGPQPQPVQP